MDGAAILASNATITLQAMTVTSGFYVEEIQFMGDGIGTNDQAVVRVTVSGHQSISEQFLMGPEGLTIKWGRPLTSAHKFALNAPQAALNKEIEVLVTARGVIPEKSSVRAAAKAVRASSNDDEKFALRNHRNRTKAHGASGAKQLLGAVGASRIGAGAIGGSVSVGSGKGGGGIASRLGSFKLG